jgi:hypothetical protein
MSIGSLQLAYYRGVGGKYGAVQFNFTPPHFYIKGTKLKNFQGRFIRDTWLDERPDLTDEDLTSREGCVFMEIASATGPNKYDWDNKIVMALNIHDLGQILQFLTFGKAGDSCNILHDPGANTDRKGQLLKKLFFSSPQGPRQGGVFISVTQTTEDKETVHNVPLDASNVMTMTILFREAVVAALGWGK